MAFAIEPARSEEDYAAVSELFEEYVAWLGIDLTFQGYTSELANLRAKYRPPGGELYLARDQQGRPLGCVGIALFPEPGACEMKRLYVRDAARRTGMGRAFVEAVIAFAEAAGYRKILLDTLPTMRSALALYRACGFEPIAPYYSNPVPGALFFCKHLGGKP